MGLWLTDVTSGLQQYSALFGLTWRQLLQWATHRTYPAVHRYVANVEIFLYYFIHPYYFRCPIGLVDISKRIWDQSQDQDLQNWCSHAMKVSWYRWHLCAYLKYRTFPMCSNDDILHFSRTIKRLQFRESKPETGLSVLIRDIFENCQQSNIDLTLSRWAQWIAFIQTFSYVRIVYINCKSMFHCSKSLNTTWLYSWQFSCIHMACCFYQKSSAL